MKTKLPIMLIILHLITNVHGEIFKNQQFIEQGYKSDDIATGDFNGDGYADLFIISEFHAHKVYFNNENTTFTPSNQQFGRYRGQKVISGDFDNDGDIDVWVGNSSRFISFHLNNFNHDQIYINDGNGFFTLSDERHSVNRTRFLISGDIDNDGDLDVFRSSFGASDTTPSIFRNNGSAQFTEEILNVEILAASFADYNGDGYLDLWSIGTNLTVYINDQSGHFNNENVIISPFGEAIYDAKNIQNMIVQDLDGDGDLDAQGFTKRFIKYIDPESGFVFFFGTDLRLPRYINNGDGTFEFHTEKQEANQGGHSDGVFINLDDDSQPELVALGTINTETEVYETLDNGTYVINNGLNINEERYRNSIAADDFDNDGDLDIITTGFSGKISVWLNQNGSLIELEQTRMNENVGSSRAFVASDINNDGHMDFATADTNGASVYLGNGRGHFNKTLRINPREYYLDIDAADFNGDGYDDFILVPYGQLPHEMWLNNQDGTFERFEEASINPEERSNSAKVSSGDFDKDGDIDLIFINIRNTVEVWTNDGQAHFTKIHSMKADYYDAKFVDIDEGGHLELLTYEGSNSRMTNIYQVYDFDGKSFVKNMVFQNSNQPEYSAYPSDIITLDWDNDGDIDVLKSEEYHVSNNRQVRTILINDGVKGFVETELFIDEAELKAEIVAAQDINNDGMIDLISEWNYVHINKGDRIFETQAMRSDVVQRLRDVMFMDYDSDGDADIITIVDDYNNGILVLNNSTVDFDYSGLWYNPLQNGHGLQIDEMYINDQKQLFVSWYVYINGAPIWLTGVGNVKDGMATIDMLITQGALFPPHFNPDDVEQTPWGQLTISMQENDEIDLSWHSIIDGFSSGQMMMQRLSSITETSTGASVIRSCHSGSWYNRQQSGHGIMVQVLNNNDTDRLLLTWFTYHNGQQFWIVAQGDILNNKAELSAISASGGEFPPDFNTSDVNFNDWGTISFELKDDTTAMISWLSNDQDFPSGELEVNKLTFIDRFRCD